MESLKKQSSGMPVKKPLITLCENADPKIYYHYTSLEKMWLILENETIRATQACFSNDNEEIIKGILFINPFLSSSYIKKMETKYVKLPSNIIINIDIFIFSIYFFL